MKIGLSFLFSLYVTLAISQMNAIEYVEYDLDNGLHVILHQDASTPIVAVSVMYHVGSKNENPDKTGFAHFFEHLLFEGSENIKRGEYDSYVESALGLWLESERMLHAKVNIEGVETQREVVKEERRQRIDNQPYGTAVQESMKRVYKSHPYRWPVIGSMEHLNAAVEADYKQFYEDFYVPDNAVLSLAGDLDIEQTKVWVEKYFASIPRSKKPIYRPDVVEPNLTSEVRDTIYDNIQLPAVIQTYKIPALGTDEFYAVSMMSTLLSQGQSSRLNKSLVDDKQMALAVGSFPFELEDPGVSIAYAICNVGQDPKDVEAAIDAEVERVKNEPISDEEFQKLKNQIENDFVSSNSRVAGIAESLANYHMYYGDAGLINKEIDRYLAVTKEDIMAAAKNYFSKDSRVVLYYLPKPTAQP